METVRRKRAFRDVGVGQRYLQAFRSERLIGALNDEIDFREVVNVGPGEALEASRARTLYVAELRALIDAWIESGRARDGVETPRERKAERRPWLSFNKHFDEPLNGAHNEVVFPGQHPTVFDLVDLWLIENPPGACLLPSGELEISLRHPKVRVSLADAAVREARVLFLLLMTTEAKYAIFRCTHHGCGVYYMLEKPRGTYFQGTVCPEHRRQQGTLKKRKRDHDEAVEIAAEALAAWPKLSASTRSKHKGEKDYIASKLKRFGVGSKWVTRNLTKISNREVSNGA